MPPTSSSYRALRLADNHASDTSGVNPPDNDGRATTDLTRSDPSLPGTPTSMKETRSYEHDRQRSRQVSELAKRRQKREARRTSWSVVWSDGVGGHGHATKTRGHGQGVGGDKERTSLDADVSVPVVALLDAAHNKENDSEVTKGGALELKYTSAVSDDPATRSREIKLVDIMKVGKNRRGNGDFVVIPNLPSVMVLDDIDENSDDTWEHVKDFDDDSLATKGPSYAEIVSGSGL